MHFMNWNAVASLVVSFIAATNGPDEQSMKWNAITAVAACFAVLVAVFAVACYKW